MNILAWDPGVGGGFAWTDNGRVCVRAMSTLEPDSTLEQFLLTRVMFCDQFIYETQVGYMGKFTASSHMFTFGKGYGWVLGVTALIRYLIKTNQKAGSLSGKPVKLIGVTPREWQKTLDLERPIKEKKPRLLKTATKEDKVRHELLCKEIDRRNAPLLSQWKRQLKEEAERAFPQLTIDGEVTLSKCDALLLLRYARQLK